MAWTTMLDADHICIRYDEADQNVILEVNDGGLQPNYVTVHCNADEVKEIVEALQKTLEVMVPLSAL